MRISFQFLPQQNQSQMGKNQNKFIWLKGMFYHQQQMLHPSISEELNYIIQIEYQLSKYNQRLKNRIKSTFSLNQTQCQQWEKIRRQNFVEKEVYMKQVLRGLIFNLPQKGFIDPQTKYKLKKNATKLNMKFGEVQKYIIKILFEITLSQRTLKKSPNIVWVGKDFPLKSRETNSQEIFYYGDVKVQENYEQYEQFCIIGREK